MRKAIQSRSNASCKRQAIFRLQSLFTLKKNLVFAACFVCLTAVSQTIGGHAAYNFLKLPASPLLTAAGGINVSYEANDVGLAANNPALLKPSFHSQLAASFNAFLAGIKTYGLTGAYHAENFKTTFGGHVYFVDYGSLPATDAAGNISGEFRPKEFVVQALAAKKYLERWTFGCTIKFIGSSYGQYSSNAVAADVGLLYNDSANGFVASVLAKNMGTQLKTFAGESEDLPFDLQVGITKRLAKAPFGFSLTAHHLHQFDLNYDDKVFNADNGFSSLSSFDKIFNHFVLATHVYMGQNLMATVGYNHLRRQELSVSGASNGLSGFSAGLQVKFSKLQIQYARSTYQRGVAYTHIGITTQLNKLMGLGR